MRPIQKALNIVRPCMSSAVSTAPRPVRPILGERHPNVPSELQRTVWEIPESEDDERQASSEPRKPSESAEDSDAPISRKSNPPRRAQESEEREASPELGQRTNPVLIDSDEEIDSAATAPPARRQRRRRGANVSEDEYAPPAKRVSNPAKPLGGPRLRGQRTLAGIGSWRTSRAH
ncbi:hypothetical protein LTR74_000112 [Friedmanniomyces endolithicus]|nr:hypothetical protein LTR74_000112 [Friedmanniomyces endolithicus]